jgi:hypothetical protein
MASISVQIPCVDFMVFFGTAASIYPNITDLCSFLKAEKSCSRFRGEIEEKQEQLYDCLRSLEEDLKASIPQIERTSMPILKRGFYEGIEPYTPDHLYEQTIAYFKLMGELEEVLLLCSGQCMPSEDLPQFDREILRLNYRIRSLATPQGFRRWVLSSTTSSFERLGFGFEMAVELQKFVRQARHTKFVSEFYFEGLQQSIKGVLSAANRTIGKQIKG